MAGLCRDCLETDASAHIAPGPCRHCGSTRRLVHDELARLTIAHLDCDAFYAAVEKRDDPSLADKPLIIGHTGGRGVVTTACYIARHYGPRSAMPMFKALRLCPDAVVKPPDMAKYQAVSRQIRALFETVTDRVEPVSIDEAYLDLGEAHHGVDEMPARSLARLALEIESEIGVTVSIGLAPNKFLAKLASDMEKPRGFSVIGGAEARAVLRDMPVTKIHGVGAATAKRMAAEGWQTIGQLQDLPADELMARFGRFGRRLALYVKGEDDRAVSVSRDTKSISAETTFDVDIAEFEPLAAAVERLAARVARRARDKTLAGHTVTLKLKSADFKIQTRTHRLKAPTQRAALIVTAARHLLAREIDGRRFRLVGVGLGNLCPAADADPPDLFDLLEDDQNV